MKEGPLSADEKTQAVQSDRKAVAVLDKGRESAI
jgi:hypothetical protein